MTRRLGDATRSSLTSALEVMAKEFPNKVDYIVELGWNLMVTRQFEKAERALQVGDLNCDTVATASMSIYDAVYSLWIMPNAMLQVASRRFPNHQTATILLDLCSKLIRRNAIGGTVAAAGGPIQILNSK